MKLGKPPLKPTQKKEPQKQASKHPKSKTAALLGASNDLSNSQVNSQLKSYSKQIYTMQKDDTNISDAEDDDFVRGRVNSMRTNIRDMTGSIHDLKLRDLSVINSKDQSIKNDSFLKNLNISQNPSYKDESASQTSDNYQDSRASEFVQSGLLMPVGGSQSQQDQNSNYPQEDAMIDMAAHIESKGSEDPKIPFAKDASYHITFNDNTSHQPDQFDIYSIRSINKIVFRNKMRVLTMCKQRTKNTSKQVDPTLTPSMDLGSQKYLEYNQKQEEQLDAVDTSDHDNYNNQKYKEQYQTGSTQIQTPSQISALALQHNRKKSIFSNLGVIQDRTQNRRTFTHKDRSSMKRFERHFSPEPLNRSPDENFKAYNDQITYSQKRYDESEEVEDYEEKYQDRKLKLIQIQEKNLKLNYLLMALNRQKLNLKQKNDNLLQKNRYGIGRTDNNFQIESKIQSKQEEQKVNNNKEPEPESIPVHSNSSTSFVRPTTQENFNARNQYSVNNVIFEENSIMGASQAFDDKYGNHDPLQQNSHYQISLLEKAIIDMDVTEIVQDPAQKKTLFMKPKTRNQAVKNQSKFRINSATARRNLNAMSTINDESRMTNFIQNENYEINSYRSNEKNSHNPHSQQNTQSIEALRESWNRQQKANINIKKEYSNQPNHSSINKLTNKDILSATVTDNLNSSFQIETQSKNLLFNKSRHNNYPVNQTNVISCQELKGNQTQKNKLIQDHSMNMNSTLISAHSRRRNNELLNQSNYNSSYNPHQFSSMNQSNSLINAEIRRNPTLQSNQDSKIYQNSIKDYQTSLTHNQTSYPKYKNLDVSYQMAKQGGRKNLSNDLMINLNQQKSLSRKRTAFSSQNNRNKKNQEVVSRTKTNLVRINEDLIDKKNLNYSQQISMNSRTNIQSVINRNKRIIINDRIHQ
ncbi:UNKNOWN [Stylonychia lemnae]|uniref:Uncharacterized protein n=1 Tax=Stylonychia lemnae TaxID=5949 RepID=A0A078AVQ1_STYLE|nr:UNKNOWN [Stylonychia lemnae]|eukprot:CDW85337.1 UNKNOWN [Stylonychia lemnae]